MRDLEVHGLYCLPCDFRTFRKPDWLQHLLQEGHQIRARKGLLKWAESERICTLLVLSPDSVGKDDKMIQYLSNVSRAPGNEPVGVVKEFVWWEEKPWLGFVRFETREQAVEVLNSLPGKNYHFPVEPFGPASSHARDAALLDETEWKRLFPVLKVEVVEVSVSLPLSQPPLEVPQPPPPQQDIPVPELVKVRACAQEVLVVPLWQKRNEQEQLASSSVSAAAPPLPTKPTNALPVLRRSKEEAENYMRLWRERHGLTAKPATTNQSHQSALGQVNGNGAAAVPEPKLRAINMIKPAEPEPFCDITQNMNRVEEPPLLAPKHGPSREVVSMSLNELFFPTFGSYPGVSEKSTSQLPPVISIAPPTPAVEKPKPIPTIPQKCRIKENHQVNSESLKNAKNDPQEPVKVLWRHLTHIRDLIEIPHEEYGIALDIMERLQEKLAGHEEADNDGNGNGPGFVVYMARHWLLKLKYSPTPTQQNSILTIVLFDKNSEALAATTDPRGISFDQLNAIEQKYFLTRGDDKEDFLSAYEILQAERQRSIGWSSLHYQVIDPITSNPFQLVIETNPESVLESQVWRLAKYICSFNPLCKPMLWVLYYWMKENAALLKTTHNQNEPDFDPSVMNWLLILYFQTETEEWPIPSAKWILARPHQALLYQGTDIGFLECPDVVLAWRVEKLPDEGKPKDEKLASEVFKHLQAFFIFCADLFGRAQRDEDRMILNTRDGEVISGNELMESKRTKLEGCQLTKREQIDIRRKISDEKDWKREKIVMLHPFKIYRRMPMPTGKVAERVIHAMKKAGLKLQYLRMTGKLGKVKLDELLSLLGPPEPTTNLKVKKEK